ncbi:phosphatidylglycerol lysyltransferase domain-containing protein [Nocardioides convexus]|uniref:phosphatidylglycerol lysyltransferase domain-containing protein n=1 Tax=Nocardioides convexus TaxID=2712224 RepID=UPI0024185011|nr:phosphatidylglycerol lysyltransferase domain-containing protein [Nocardioides convexus]
MAWDARSRSWSVGCRPSRPPSSAAGLPCAPSSPWSGPCVTRLAPLFIGIGENVLLILPNLAYATFLGLLAAALSARKRAGWRILVIVLLVNLADAAGEPDHPAAQPRRGRRRTRAAVGRGDGPGRVHHPGPLPLGRQGDRDPPPLPAGEHRDRVRPAPGLPRHPADERAAALVGQPRHRRRDRTARLRRPSRGLGQRPDRLPRRGLPARLLRRRLPVPGAALGALGARGAGGARAPGGVRPPRLPRLLRHPPRQDRDLLRQRPSGGALPGRGRRLPRQRRPDRRPGLVGQRDRQAGRSTPRSTAGPRRCSARASEARTPSSAPGSTPCRLGDEAIIDVADFHRRRPRLRPIQRAVRRTQRLGITVRIRRHGQISAEDMARVQRLAEEWRGDEPERGFSMALGRLGDPADADCLLAEALAPDGTVLALLSFVPWGRSGISLDLMRRDPAAPNGVIEPDRQHARRARCRAPDLADLAQLRGAPLGLRGGRPDRRRAGAARLATGAAGALPVVAGWRRCTALT